MNTCNCGREEDFVFPMNNKNIHICSFSFLKIASICDEIKVLESDNISMTVHSTTQVNEDNVVALTPKAFCVLVKIIDSALQQFNRFDVDSATLVRYLVRTNQIKLIFKD